MIDVATFRAGYPEFKDAPDSLVTAKLEEATILVPIGVWGALQQQAAFLYCARFLSLSPFGRHMSLAKEDGSTLYDERLDRLRFTVTSGFRVL